MKKLFAILLVLVMLVPMCLTAHAAEEASEVVPFNGIAWAGAESGRYDNMASFGSVWFDVLDDQIFVYAWANGGKITGVKKVAAMMKDAMDKVPEGMRVIQFQQAQRALPVKAEAVLFMDYGVNKLKNIADSFFKEFKALGGKLDMLIMDVEYFNVQSYYLYSRVYMSGNPNIYFDIINHPKYATEIRPQLVERGFKFYEGAAEKGLPEIWSLYPYSGDQYETSRFIWDQIVRTRTGEYVNQAFYEPLKEHFPGVSMSDYQVADTWGWNKTMSRVASKIYLGGNLKKAGNTSNLNSYFIAPNLSVFSNTSYPVPESFNKTYYEDDSFGQFIWDMNRFKSSYEATDTKKFHTWLAEYDSPWDERYSERESSTCNTAYYSETIFHLGLLNPELFLLFTPREVREDLTDEEFQKRIDVIYDCLKELTRVVGTADRETVFVRPNWNNGFVLSGMYSGGRNVWRISPDTTEGVSLEDFKVEGKDPTFSIYGKTITFPQGKIIEDGDVRILGTCGYWVETPADVTPVITTTDDIYAKYPSYTENYEQYTVGEEYKYMDIKPAIVWEFSIDSGDKPMVVEHNGSKAVSMTGTTGLLNIRMPGNITAGDYYAKNQAWEVTVTPPENMGADEAVFFLGVNDEDWIASDRGFKIQGGSVYYDENGEFKQISGVSLTGGQTYTFKRVVHMETEGAFTSDYYVYDANGKELGSAVGAAMADAELPVGGIKLECENLQGDVIFDDYKLYPTGLSTCFEIYQADVGIIFTDTETPKNEATAYRLSWLNGTDTNSNATIMAAYYEGETLVNEVVVKEVELGAFNDGVEIGIVDVQEGQSVLVYLKTAGGDKRPPIGGGSNNPIGGSASADDILLPLIVIGTAMFVILAMMSTIVLIVWKYRPDLLKGKKK